MPVYLRSIGNSWFFVGIRNIMIYSVPFIDDLSLYTQTIHLIDGVNYFDSAFLSYFWPYLLVKLIPWSFLPLVSLFFLFSFSLLNVFLIYSLIKKFKYSYLLAPLFYFCIPAFKFPNVLLVTFFLLALKYKSRPYLSTFLMSFSILFKQYMLVPALFFILLNFKKKSQNIWKTIMAFITPQLVYLPFGLSNVLNAFSSIGGHGFGWNLNIASYLFPSLLFLMIVGFNLYKKLSRDLLLVLFSALFMIFSQFKLGSELYVNIFCVFFLLSYNKFKGKYDHLFLIFICVLFFVSFFETNNTLFIPNYARISEINRGSLDLLFDGQNVLFTSLYGTPHPLFLSESVFANITVYNGSQSISDFDLVVFSIHNYAEDPLGANVSNCMVVPFYWNECYNCNQLFPVCFTDINLYFEKYPVIAEYYASYSNELCSLSPWIFNNKIKSVFPMINYDCDRTPFLPFLSDINAHFDTYMIIKSIIIILLFLFYLFLNFKT